MIIHQLIHVCDRCRFTQIEVFHPDFWSEPPIHPLHGWSYACEGNDERYLCPTCIGLEDVDPETIYLRPVPYQR